MSRNNLKIESVFSEWHLLCVTNKRVYMEQIGDLTFLVAIASSSVALVVLYGQLLK